MAEDNENEALNALRRRIDAIDDGLHDLIMRRAGLVEEVGRLKHLGDVAPFRPGREAQVLRRLAARHDGRFPRAALIRIWREIMSGAVALQGEVSVAVCAGCWDLARDHFGSLTPLRLVPSAAAAVLAVAEGRAGLGVVPVAEDDDPAPWWLALGTLAEKRPFVVARLPFGALGNGADRYADAFVVAAMAPEASGDDCTLLAVAAGPGRSGDVTGSFRKARLDANPIARADGAHGAAHLIEIAAGLGPDDVRLAPLRAALGAGGRMSWLGLYARKLPDAMGAVAPE